MSRKVLIVEDDKDLSKLVKYNLEKAGFECVQVFQGDQVLSSLSHSRVDLIILDIMLPGMDGLSVCRAVKGDKRTSQIPVLMLTARGEEVDRVVGFELGADDYVVKPFSPRELVLRVKAILRRTDDRGEDKVLSAGDIEVNESAHQAFVKGKEIELAPMEFKLLAKLMSSAGRVQSREKLLDDVWGLGADVFTRTVDTHIKRLREKLGKEGSRIETVVGLGYRFRGDRDEA